MTFKNEELGVTVTITDDNIAVFSGGTKESVLLGKASKVDAFVLDCIARWQSNEIPLAD